MTTAEIHQEIHRIDMALITIQAANDLLSYSRFGIPAEGRAYVTALVTERKRLHSLLTYGMH